MKDRPTVDAVAPSSSISATSIRARVRGVLSHFWKLFAITGLVAGVCAGYRVVPRRYATGQHTGQESSLTELTSDDDGTSRGQHGYRFRLMRDLIDRQSQPATIVFKNQAPAALGYLASVDEECVVLRSFYKDEAKEQTILIPWDNVLYIRLNTKMPPREQEVMAARDSGPKPSVRARR